ncbi:methionyl-tRNA formyltransferase [Lachnospiraceae bacterium]|uniref:methionyl-tRNA formyltransferase n=1 Tax=Candidatus Merdisoma sp. JLR.KK011 TaxID=3114299 RepID=UPI00143494A3|nr:methionyl-tRNA formyltransferase [Lachnospiraceae bacterium]
MKDFITIGYFADGPWAHKAFEKLMQDETIHISFICVRYDKRDKVLQELGEKNHIDVLYSPNVNSAEFIEKVKKYEADLFVSMSFNQIFKKELIDLPPMKTINCHAGKLPYYRGRNILNWVLINDEKEFGITVHYVDEGVDTGDIILQDIYPITDKDTYQTLLEKAYTGCSGILYRAVKLLQSGNVKIIKQNDISAAGLYCGIRKENDEILDWNQDSRSVFNFIRALTYPGPCACSFIEGRRIKMISAELVPGAPSYKGIPGQVLIKTKEFCLVKTKDSYIKITDYEGRIKTGDRMGMEKNG